MALVSTIVLRAIGTLSADPATDVASYGVVTRILGFAFLPQMAFALTVQTITGNNVGAERKDRALAALKLGMGCAFFWCLGVTLTGVAAGEGIGALFSDELAVAQATGRIMTIITLLYVATGPILVLAMHFQAMGHPVRTAVLTLAKPWLLTPAFIVALSARFGPDGIWAAFPCADAVLLALALTIGRRGGLAPAQNSATLGENK